MSGASFTLDSKGFMAALSGAVAHFVDTAPLAAAIGEAMVASTRQRFQAEEGPDGKAWEKSGRAEAEGGQTLTDTARLKNSIGYEAARDLVAWGTNAEYGAIHQYGGEIKPKKGKFLKFKGSSGKDVFVKSVKMPARPYIGINDEDREEAAGLIREYMAAGFGI